MRSLQSIAVNELGTGAVEDPRAFARWRRPWMASWFGVACVAAIPFVAVAHASDGPCAFDLPSRSYVGTPVEQARCLLRPVPFVAHERRFGEPLSSLPGPLESLVGQPIEISKAALRELLRADGISEAEIGGAVSERLSMTRPPEVEARYFIIHDTSSPSLAGTRFPGDIDSPAKVWNKTTSFSRATNAHLFVTRPGGSIGPGFSVRIATTKFDARLHPELRGLMIGVELRQPRIKAPGFFVAPEPGFTVAQMDRLALAYVAASVRKGDWLIPAFHGVVDLGIENGHDDPQHFDLALWASRIAMLLPRLRTLTLSISPQITAGGSHTCGLTHLGLVRCWGHNGFGQLGDGTTVASMAPGPPLPIQGTRLTAGTDHTCAVLPSRQVSCWGNNSLGQLGQSTSVLRHSTVPVIVPGLSHVDLIAAGANHTCAIANQQAWCWGANSHGQLGNNSSADSATPVAVTGLPLFPPPLSIVAGALHTCAVVSGGSVYCWGDNSLLQLMDTAVQSRVAIPLVGIAGVSSLAAGRFHTCGLLGTGVVLCWGQILEPNASTAAPASVTFREEPTNREYSPKVVTISAGFMFSCAAIEEPSATSMLASEASIKCWGASTVGQTGIGTVLFVKDPRFRAGGLMGVQSIAAGERHACALMTGGVTQCWGFNGLGQLGDTTLTTRLTPVPIAFDWR